jgi:hypothetical protein
MTSAAVCTLFEKDYHYGLAALVNSLVSSGFEGGIYAGYRGSLPPWARSARATRLGAWSDAHVMDVGGACQLAFLPMRTSAHFTNIKPDFMLQLFAEDAVQIERMFYLDPDICVTQAWKFMEDWLSCGVALCEDINSPVDQHHPRREGWRRYFGRYDITFEFPTALYVNGGCVGVSRAEVRFLENWQRLSRHMADEIGGLGAAQIEGGAKAASLGFAQCFDRSDQDALNATIGMTRGMNCSILPQAAMGFVPGASVMPHAIGPAKPWRRQYLREALAGRAPVLADKVFWNNLQGPLHPMTRRRVRGKRAAVKLASALGRWYRRR